MSMKLLRIAIRGMIHEASKKRKPKAPSIVLRSFPNELEAGEYRSMVNKPGRWGISNTRIKPNGSGGFDVVYSPWRHETPSESKKSAERMRAWADKQYDAATSGGSKTASPSVDMRKALRLLTFAFTSTVKKTDIQHIQYRASKHRIHLQDVGHALGNMWTGLSSTDTQAELGITPEQFGRWLASQGAQAIKPQKRVRSFPIYD